MSTNTDKPPERRHSTDSTGGLKIWTNRWVTANIVAAYWLSRSQLRNFANATRQLGSSVAILSSAYHLRGRIAQILFLYHENAADLFPRKITHAPREAVADAKTKGRRSRKGKKVARSAPPHVARPAIDETLDLVSLLFVPIPRAHSCPLGKISRTIRGIGQNHHDLWQLPERVSRIHR